MRPIKKYFLNFFFPNRLGLGFSHSHTVRPRSRADLVFWGQNWFLKNHWPLLRADLAFFKKGLGLKLQFWRYGHSERFVSSFLPPSPFLLYTTQNRIAKAILQAFLYCSGLVIVIVTGLGTVSVGSRNDVKMTSLSARMFAYSSQAFPISFPIFTVCFLHICNV